MNMKRGGLGKGLGIHALIPQSDTPGVLELDITKIEPNKGQPRRHFDEESLRELAESVKQHGVIQPILVNRDGEFYTIIAGERRFRAAKMAKLATVPAIVKEYSDLETLEVALIENLQRTDLNAIEEAVCYKRLVDEFGLTHEDIASRISKSRASVTNCMRLLGLDERVKSFLADGLLSAGHGKALLSIADNDAQFGASEEFIEKGMSVREAESYVNAIINAQKQDNKEKKKDNTSDFSRVERELENALGTKIRIRANAGKSYGKIEISYSSANDLDRLYLLLRNPQ